MVKFIDLQTNDDRWIDDDGNEVRRKVSIAYSDKRPGSCNLLGNLPHQTEFTRAELATFALKVLDAFGYRTDTNERS